MNNFFITDSFDWGWQLQGGRWIDLGNRLLRMAGTSWSLARRMTPYTHTTTIEQRANLWHLASQPLAYGVPGDLVELGCFDGKTATIFARAIEQFAPGRPLHLYDHFRVKFHLEEKDIEQEVLDNFKRMNCPPPVIHKGDFKDTVPAELPATICFAHLDCGFQQDIDLQKKTILGVLGHVYPRLSRGAVCTFMDYYDLALCKGRNAQPGVALAVNEFLADKPEKIVSMWGGDYAHAFFHKV